MSIGIIASLLLSLGVAWLVLSPLFEVGMRHDSCDADPLGPLLDAKERSLRSLKDLEMDFAMGKVSREDFEQSRKTLTAEVASILDKINTAGGVR